MVRMFTRKCKQITIKELLISAMLLTGSFSACQEDPTAKPILPLPKHTSGSKTTPHAPIPETETTEKPENTDAEDLQTLCEASVHSVQGNDVKSDCAKITNPNINHFCVATTPNTFSDEALHECTLIDERGTDYYNLCTALVNSHKNLKISKGYCEKITTDDIARLCFAWVYANHPGYDSKQFCLAIEDPVLSAFCDANVPAPGYKPNLASCEKIEETLRKKRGLPPTEPSPSLGLQPGRR